MDLLILHVSMAEGKNEVSMSCRIRQPEGNEDKLMVHMGSFWCGRKKRIKKDVFFHRVKVRMYLWEEQSRKTRFCCYGTHRVWQAEVTLQAACMWACEY